MAARGIHGYLTAASERIAKAGTYVVHATLNGGCSTRSPRIAVSLPKIGGGVVKR